MRTLIDNKWIRTINKNGQDEFTFCGALEDRYKHISLYWNADTQKKHDREFNNIILPALSDHNNKTIREYTSDDYRDAIERIKEKGYERDGIKYTYTPASIHNYETLIYYVVFQASAYGYCEDVLKGTRFEIDVTDEFGEIESRVLIKKSLSVKQEKSLAKEVADDVCEHGGVVALLLMWGIGLRNAEACGLNYGDIRPLEEHSDCNVAWIYKTTKIDSTKLQSGGKTYNTGRIIPVPQKIMGFLTKRKEIICKLIKEQGDDIDINSLPICCNGWIEQDSKSYIKRCTADDVTLAARDVFEMAGISSKQLAYLDLELSEGNVATLLKEKEPTAYLLRRNFATQMSILGLTTSEMQYLIGHDVEDAYESRNEFVDSERIYSMYLKLSQREFLNNTGDNCNRTEICIPRKKTMKIHISAKEPTDNIGVDISINDDIKPDFVNTKWFEGSTDITHDRTVNILKYYHEKYS